MDTKAINHSLDEIGLIKRCSPPSLDRVNLILRQLSLAIDAVTRDPAPEPPVIDIKQVEADRLREDATKYHNFILHAFWDVHNLKDLGVKEPERGCGKCQDSWDQWMDSLGDTGKQRTTITDEMKADYLNPFNLDQFKKPARLDGFKTGDSIK